MSSEELAEEYEVRQKTCWEFKWKVQQAMKSSGRYPLDGEVHVDEFYVGGEEEGTHGRGAKKKRLQGYLDEYHFRFNRRNNKDTIFDVLIRRMVYNKPIRLKSTS